MTTARIIVDTHEGSRIPRELTALGAEVEVRTIAVGDYIVGASCGIERKTVRDLHLGFRSLRL